MPHPELQVFLTSGEVDCKPLHLARVDGVERISSLFRFEILAVAFHGATFDVDAATGAPATLVFHERGEEVRRLHGMIIEATDLLDTVHEQSSYRLVFVPRAWALTLTQTQQVFIDASIPDIVHKQLQHV